MGFAFPVMMKTPTLLFPSLLCACLWLPALPGLADDFHATLTDTSTNTWVEDFAVQGKVGKGGLHQRQSHTSIRNTCLNRFNEEFRRVLGISLPKQHYVAVVVPNATGPSHSLVPYNGNRMRLHRDCKKVSTQLGDPCSWK